MLIPRVAKRYAQAAYDAVPADLPMEAFLADLQGVRTSLEQSRELRNFFASPVISFAKKESVVQELFRGVVHDYTYKVILFLTEKRREHLLAQVIEAVFDLNRAKKGIRKAAIISARALDENQQEALTAALAGMTKGQIDSSYELDERLLGGVIVRVDDKVYDGSVSRQLQRLRQRFILGTVS